LLGISKDFNLSVSEKDCIDIVYTFFRQLRRQKTICINLYRYFEVKPSVAMKRSSSIAALDDTNDVKLRNTHSCFQESSLVESMMLVSIEGGNQQRNRILQKHRSDGSMSSMGSASTLRSLGSLPGWGSSTSRKSYKVDLCNLVGDDEFSERTTVHHRLGIAKDRRNKLSRRTTPPKSAAVSSSINTPVTNNEFEWGFFLE